MNLVPEDKNKLRLQTTYWPSAGYTYSGALCRCPCHKTRGIKHIMVCCFPKPPKKETYIKW